MGMLKRSTSRRIRQLLLSLRRYPIRAIACGLRAEIPSIRSASGPRRLARRGRPPRYSGSVALRCGLFRRVETFGLDLALLMRASRPRLHPPPPHAAITPTSHTHTPPSEPEYALYHTVSGQVQKLTWAHRPIAALCFFGLSADPNSPRRVEKRIWIMRTPSPRLYIGSLFGDTNNIGRAWPDRRGPSRPPPPRPRRIGGPYRVASRFAGGRWWWPNSRNWERGESDARRLIFAAKKRNCAGRCPGKLGSPKTGDASLGARWYVSVLRPTEIQQGRHSMRS